MIPPGAGEAFARSLDLVAERCADPAPLVYARLFAARPELEALFIRDRAGSVRGQMLAVAIEALLDLAGEGHYAAGLLHSERVNHEGLGVPPDAFDGFYPVLHEVFRGLAAACWTAEMEAAWLALLAEARAG